MHTTEVYLWRNGTMVTANVKKSNDLDGAMMTEDECLAIFGVVPESDEKKKVRITVEEIEEPPNPPEPLRMCWFKLNGHMWTGQYSRCHKNYRVENSLGNQSVFSQQYLESEGVEIHWYDDE